MDFIVSPSFPHIGEKIFSYLDFESLLNCSKVCQTWEKFIDSHEFWWFEALLSAEKSLLKNQMDPVSFKSWKMILDQGQDQVMKAKGMFINHVDKFSRVYFDQF